MYRLSLMLLSLLVVMLSLLGCAAGGDVTQPVPTHFVAAPQSAQRLVVVLPGRGDSLPGLIDTGIAEVIQQQWPAADVLLTGLTMPFYTQRQAVQRLHDEVIVAARRTHHGEIWLLGISLGGMGALMYDRAYPDEIDGLILLSPFLGRNGIHREIRAAGGLAEWQAEPMQPTGADSFESELWRYLQGWTVRPQRTQSVWLAYGADEPFRRPISLMAPLLAADHVIELPGRHNWELWLPATTAVLQRIDEQSGSR